MTGAFTGEFTSAPTTSTLDTEVQLAPAPAPKTPASVDIRVTNIATGPVTGNVDPTTGQPLTTDQRGLEFPRIIHIVVDIGAFEFAGTFLDVTTQPPASVTAGSGFGLSVTAEDSSGAVDTSFTGTVTVALLNNPGGATLGDFVDRDRLEAEVVSNPLHRRGDLPRRRLVGHSHQEHHREMASKDRHLRVLDVPVQLEQGAADRSDDAGLIAADCGDCQLGHACNPSPRLGFPAREPPRHPRS